MWYFRLASAIAALWSVYLINKVIYNLCFHPLAKYKGPKLWSAFRFPFVHSLLTGNLPHRVRSMHDFHGEVVRVAPDELSFTNPAAWKDIHTKGFLRPYQYRSKPPGKDAENLISASEEDHQRFRKVLGPAFMVHSEQEAVVQSYVNLLICKLASRIESDDVGGSAVVDILQWINYTTFDIIGGVLWGSSFSCLEEVRYHPWIEVIAQFKTTLIVLATKFYYPMDKILMIVTPISAMADLMQIWKTTEEKICQRLQVGSKQVDMISYMSSGQGSPLPPYKSDLQMSMPEIEINAMLIVVGGSESVTTG